MMRNVTGTRGVSAVVVPLAVSRRHVTRLYTSFYRGNLFPNQMVVPHSRLPRGASVAQVLKLRNTPQGETSKTDKDTVETTPVSWDDAASTDLIHVNSAEGGYPVAEQRPKRPYVPLSEVAKMELQGDYLSEGGLHQEALEHYGVVAKAYEFAYPENHLQRAGILVKLSGAFRRTGRLESSKANLEKALAILDGCSEPSLEIIVECLLELGLTKEALGEAEAGSTFEDAVAVVNTFHNHGDSHRMLRLLPRLGRRFNLNHEEKFLYYSPFDYDRTFALADQCLERAEKYYQKKGDSTGVIRVLQTRKELLDKKFFNMRDFSGRIRTMRGHWHRRARVLTNAPPRRSCSSTPPPFTRCIATSSTS
ncbi:hypothetical protein AGDE_07452 [Angomonas deanei]|nr:hypothetical protein AGDE_07452 [Angomonas deanei]|eukprot:EPY35332.1 hypothetical protein AGDE_07452 [Angomonas deanei]